MIFTDKFVYVHAPKTGGTFVASALLRLHGITWSRWTHLSSALRTNLSYTGKYGTFIYNNNKHGGCNAIPPAQRDKPILATVRNPYDLYVSEYEFGWWRRRQFLKYYRQVPGFEQRYAHFPDLSFDEYLSLTTAAFGMKLHHADDDRWGLQTEKYVNFYFKNPQQVLRQIDEEYLASQKYRADLHYLHFVRTDDLNRGLYDFLFEMGYSEEDLHFVLDLGKILPQGKGRTHEQEWEKYYTPELKRAVRHRDRLIFAMFPEFDA